MLIYYILLVVSVAAGIPLCSKKCGKAGKIIYCVVFALVFTFISAVRFQVGYDYNSYGRMYADMLYYEFEDITSVRTEKGVLLPMYFLNLGFEQYYTIFIVTSVINYFAIFYLIYKNSLNPWVSVAAFMCFGLFFNSLCFLRQFIASLIIAYAIRYVGEKNYARFFVLILAAGTFHWSALLMLGLYFLLNIKPTWKYLGAVTAGTILFCIFSKKFMMMFINNFYMYRGYNPETSVEASQGLSPRYTVMFGVLFIICFLLRKRLTDKNPNNAVYINCLMYTTVFEAMGIRHGILSRFAILTYIPPILYLIPDMTESLGDYFEEKKGKTFKWLSYSVLTAFSVIIFTVLMLNNYNGVVPYVSQFNRPYDIFIERVDTSVDEPDEEIDEDIGSEDWEEEFDSEEFDDESDEDILDEEEFNQSIEEVLG